MNPWLRLHRSSLHHPKIVTLSDRQHRVWHNCLLMADDDGTLPSIRDMASHLRMSVPDAEQVVCDLVEAQLVDAAVTDGQRVYRMHKWDEWQFKSDSSSERVKKHREAKRNTTETGVKRYSNADVTPPDSESDTDTDRNPTNPESDAAREDLVGRPHDPFFEKCKSVLNGTTERAVDIVRNADGPYGTKASAAEWLSDLIDDTSAAAVVEAIRLLEGKQARREFVRSPKALICKTAQTARRNEDRRAKAVETKSAAPKPGTLRALLDNRRRAAAAAKAAAEALQ